MSIVGSGRSCEYCWFRACLRVLLVPGEQYGADRVWLNKIEDWGTMDDFKDHNIFNTAHNEHTQYQTLLDNLKQRAEGNNLIEAPTLFKY